MAIRSDIGLHGDDKRTRVYVNGKRVPPDHVLRNGEWHHVVIVSEGEKR